MKAVLSQNPQNRVGLVAYSDNSEQIMPIDRYTADNDEYLVRDTQYHSYVRGAFVDKYNTSHEAKTYWFPNLIKTADSLSYEGGENGIHEKATLSSISMDFTGAWDKTYTQQGIQDAYDLFNNVPTSDDDSQNKRMYYDGSSYQSRKPVIILVTDGDPTLCTFNYMYPKEGPTYGQGGSHGVEGYYTVLTANYFKNLTSLLYDAQASFYTIGINISTDYQKAVLNPTQATVSACNGGDDATSQQFYNLMEEQGGSQRYGPSYLRNIKPQDMKITDEDPDDNYYIYYTDYYLTIGTNGVTSPLIRGISNPYLTTDSSGNTVRNYSYCDGAWFDSFDEKGMTDVLSQILQKVQIVNDYNFLLEEGTNLEITDPLGDDMEVKGTPVLRIYENNYAPDSTKTVTGDNYVEYHWSGTVKRPESDAKKEVGFDVSLDGITARVTTVNGVQTVKFTVPAETLPTFYPNLHKTFYYEEMPIRLIYRVGLTDEEIASLNATTAEIDETYYTNDFTATDKNGLTTVTFTPDKSNKYYTPSNTSLNSKTAKDENATFTSNYLFTEALSSTANSDGNYTVTQTLGNNGLINVQREAIIVETYEMPETGGIGTQWFTVGGTAILTVGCFIYIVNKHKIKKASRGGGRC
jgi:LPXTG-motif cell wall-anchored protein